MPRKTARQPQEKLMNVFASATPELMPFQNSSKYSTALNAVGCKLEAAKAAFPIFGGTSPEPKDESSSSDSNTDTKKQTKTDSGSDSGGGDSQEEITPEKFSELMANVAQLTAKNTELQNAVNGYVSKEEQARRDAQGREETLTEDLTNAQKTIDAQDQVIKSLALINAIQGNKNYRFHNPQDVIMRLDHSAYQFDVDLENNRASVTGLDNELKRIASDADYLLVKPNGATDQNVTTRRTPRGTGAPPGPPPSNPTASNRRKELEAKWPVIASGRAPMH